MEMKTAIPAMETRLDDAVVTLLARAAEKAAKKAKGKDVGASEG